LTGGSQIKKQVFHFKNASAFLKDSGVVVLTNILSPSECMELMTFATAQPNQKKYSPYNHYDNPEIRVKMSLLNQKLADFLWSRISSFVPEISVCHKPIGIYEVLRFEISNVWNSAQDFNTLIHQDSFFRRRDFSEICLLSAILYINHNFEGGETSFYNKDCDKEFSVQPQAGSVALFPPDIFHVGIPLRKGSKIILHAKIMFENIVPTA
jgi:hypothetical protein